MHPRLQLDEVIHAPIRLAIVATLAQGDEFDFKALRDVIDISDSLLSRQINTLEQAGYVEVQKGFVGKRPRTWISLTDNGLAAFRSHVKAFERLVRPSKW